MWVLCVGPFSLHYYMSCHVCLIVFFSQTLDISACMLGTEGAKHVAEAVKQHVSALRFIWHRFELDLTSGSTLLLFMDIAVISPPRGH